MDQSTENLPVDHPTSYRSVERVPGGKERAEWFVAFENWVAVALLTLLRLII
jgi:hypothetical protein